MSFLPYRAIELIMEKDIVQGTLLERMPQKQCTVLHYACVQMNFQVGQSKIQEVYTEICLSFFFKYKDGQNIGK